MPTLYRITIATTQGGLTTPLLKDPSHAKRIPPERVITASKKEKLIGLPGWELFWSQVSITEFDDLIARCGGRDAHSIAGWLRMIDWKTRNSSQETWSDHSCYLDQPEEGDFPIFGTRFGIRVVCRDVLPVTNLAL